MMLVLLLVGLRIQVLSISILATTIPEVASRCGCHGIPGPGFFAQNRPSSGNHNFDALPVPDGRGGSGEGREGSYSIPNFRVLMFQPTFLDFQEQPVGMPHVRSIGEEFSFTYSGWTLLVLNNEFCLACNCITWALDAC